MTRPMQPAGELVVTRMFNPLQLCDELRIDKADPVIEVSKEILDEIRRGSPFATYEPASRALTITGSNREVIYRLGDLDPRRLTYRAEWPD